MKRILLSLCIAACTLCATAKNYTDKLAVTINGISFPEQETSIEVETDDNGKLRINLLNFILDSGMGDKMYVGHIRVNNIDVTKGDDYGTFTTSQVIRIAAGDNPEEDWIGPGLEDVPIEMTGKITDDKFYCTIDIEMVSFGQTIHVIFGTDNFPSAIASAKADNPDKLVDVYTILGTLAKSKVRKAEATNGLQPGIYIVDGKKVIKR